MFIEPIVSQQQAGRLFSTEKSSFPLVSKFSLLKRHISPERLEVVYLPFYLFDVLVEKDEKRQKNTPTSQQHVALFVDGLLGHTVLYAEHGLDLVKGLQAPGPACDFEISSSEAAKMALDQYKGILLEHGLRTRSHPHATEISEGRKIYYPFWVAYFKKKKGYDFKALDGVSGEIQGIKMRRIFIKALKSLQ